jgi:hypothetical protein
LAWCALLRIDHDAAKNSSKWVTDENLDEKNRSQIVKDVERSLTFLELFESQSQTEM